jgi:hypothetical protein
LTNKQPGNGNPFSENRIENRQEHAMNEKLLSRRDWFRLRIPTQTTHTTSPSQAMSGLIEPDNRLAAIPHPPNYDGLDPDQFPPMCAATLDQVELQQLASDIANLAHEISLLSRMSGTHQPGIGDPNARENLWSAFQKLQSGNIKRLQIRYSWNGARWIDTLDVREDSQYRLVRIRHAEFEA